MGVLAENFITLTSVNDAVSVSLTPSSCIIKADYTGSVFDLSSAKTVLQVFQGERALPYTLSVKDRSDVAIDVNYTLDTNGTQISITSLPIAIESGWILFTINTEDGSSLDVKLSFSVVRESSMLDWIQDWNSNRTEISGKYIVTPQIFAGYKDPVTQQLSGVYVGNYNNTPGLYGFLNDKQIFSLDQTGGAISGWKIGSDYIVSPDNNLYLDSKGEIKAQAVDGTVHWGLFSNGAAQFANGNVLFKENGDVKVAGEIIASSGIIGGWFTNEISLSSEHIVLDPNSHYIGISYAPVDVAKRNKHGHYQQVTTSGGIALMCTDLWHFGIEGWGVFDGEIQKIFSLGAYNQIAGWWFDNDSLYSGIKVNTAHQFTSASGDITIGSAGIRGYGWYIDSDGESSFMNGAITFNRTGGSLVGWDIATHRLSTSHVALLSLDSYAGIFLTKQNIKSIASSGLASQIQSKGGIFLYTDNANTRFSGFNDDGAEVFRISSDTGNLIGGWNFSHTAIYHGTITNSGFTKSKEITLSETGIRGCGWRFEDDGAGAIARGTISWTADGNVVLGENVYISWNSSTGTGTQIFKDGLFTGKISADNITAGTISTASVTSDGNWLLAIDGSGYLAQQHIKWNATGDLKIEAEIIANSGSIGGFQISSNCIGAIVGANDTPGSSNQAEWAKLSLYNDLIKVGGGNGYIMFGDNVLPSSLGNDQIATGRIVNNAQHDLSSVFPSANYGLFIDVTGAAANYGIKSNAAIVAPVCIGTQVKLLTLTGGTTEFNFSQHNIFLLYADSNMTLSMPSEATVAKWFGYSSGVLPEDFGIILVFRVRKDSHNIFFENIYDANEYANRYELGSGDSIQILVSKADGFRYQVLNHSY